MGYLAAARDPSKVIASGRRRRIFIRTLGRSKSFLQRSGRAGRLTYTKSEMATMLSQVRGGHETQYFPQPIYPYQQPQYPYSTFRLTAPPSGSDDGSWRRSSTSNLRDSEAPVQQALSFGMTNPFGHRPIPHFAHGSSKDSVSEHMLRRKTPNGTLAAGYDGSPVESDGRPHASKHFLLPLAQPSGPHDPAFASNHLDPPGGSNLLSTSQQSRLPRLGHTQLVSGPIESLQSDLIWHPKSAPMAGCDSVLHQASPYSQQYRLADELQSPMTLQPMWPPRASLAMQACQPFLGTWSSSETGPQQPLALRDELQKQDNLSGLPNPSVTQTPTAARLPDRVEEFNGQNVSAWPSPYHRKPGYINQQECPLTFTSQPTLVNPTLMQQRQGWRNGNLQEYDRPGASGIHSPNGVQHQLSTLDHAYSNLKVSTVDLATSDQNVSRNGLSLGHSHFKEKVLVWAHRVYGNLLAAIEQERRNPLTGQSEDRSRPNQHNTRPRRPYPAWTNYANRHQSWSNAQFPRVQNHSYTTQNAPSPEKVASFGTANLRNAYGMPVFDAKYHPYNVNSMQAIKSRHINHLRNGQNVAQASYVPEQLTQDHSRNTPITTATYAAEMLGRLCEESKWLWNDGMQVNGCLAYGLGHFNKAFKLFSRILENDANNLEAMSNLAATLLSVGKKQEAEQLWLRCIKVDPAYFDAVEHLVGLLHECQRGKEAVGIVEHIEQTLRHTGNSHEKTLSYESAIDGGSTVGDTSHKEVSAFRIPVSENGRLLALIHGKGNVLYQMGDNSNAAKAFEDAILIGAGRQHQDIRSLIKSILIAFSNGSSETCASVQSTFCTDEPVLLPPDKALETSSLVFPPHGVLPGLGHLSSEVNQKAAVSIVSNSLLSLAKIYQDGMSSSGASATAPRATSGVQDILALYYLSLSLQPSPSTANNVGILLAGVQQSTQAKSNARHDASSPSSVPGVVPGSGVALALAYYDYGLKLDPRHAHLYTNLGSLFKDIGQLTVAIQMYEKAVDCDGNFDIALANLANAVKDKGDTGLAITYYKRAVTANPDFAEAVCGLANALNSVCRWAGRGGISPATGIADRWHVNENGLLYDSKVDKASKSGWIERVVAIVDKQLIDGQNWGQHILQSVGVENLLKQLGPSYSHSKEPKEAQSLLKSSVAQWSGDVWEGAKVVRLVERATKRLCWQIYQDKYVLRRSGAQVHRARPQLPAALAVPSAPTVLPFHSFTCPLSAKQIRKISQRNGLRVSCSTLRAPWLPGQVFSPPAPPQKQLNVGYVSSDFNNHPLAHLMQSVFGMHDSNKVRAICYATTASDGSIHRQQIEREAPVFYDAASWSVERLVNQVVKDGIHILINLNGYTRGAKNEVFAARPAPIQMSFMGFAGTLGAEWCDYLLADKIAIPPQTLRPYRNNIDMIDQIRDGNYDESQPDDWVYGENIIFARDSFFCCDHRQSAPDAHEEHLSWPEEQRRRWKMRKELFPDLSDDAIILGNFNQLYKVRNVLQIRNPGVCTE